MDLVDSMMAKNILTTFPLVSFLRLAKYELIKTIN